ncbi:BACON domain-containing protein [Sphingobacterium bovisgrunnientis]|jgi:hypothetical protein|uniref:BACON domain-containing protein n=1 Tax=Sphingobacterium bovisgrunnientis TaxID=1874697 RepID=UPI001358D56F|nr:BACON domain-containing protein [Sphingobacterium bovisgrunnientis]
MKKEGFKSYVLLLTIFIGFFTSCDKEEVMGFFLDKTTDQLAFPWEGGEKGFAFTTNGESWTLDAPDDEWISFDLNSGTGTGKRQPVLVTVAPNKGEQREGKIQLKVGQEVTEILVQQEDGRLNLGEATINAELFNIGEDIKDVYISIPYQKGIVDDQILFTVTMTGDGAPGFNPITDHPIVLTSTSGEILIPLSGKPTVTGNVTFTVSTSDVSRGLEMPAPITKEVFDPNKPHPDALPFVISGFMADPNGADGNQEYVQFLALRDITFDNGDNAYSLIICNNAGTTGAPGAGQLDRRQDFPPNGWVSGTYTINNAAVNRTYKINITSGTVQKGQYFYVGGTGGRINGPNSTSIPEANWVKQHDYVNNPGDDGVGAISTGLFANSGVTSGLAVFKGTTIDHETEPMDVIFIGPGTGALYGLRSYAPFTGQERGYRVTTTDHYTVAGTNTRFYRQGTNTWSVAYAAQNQFYELRGAYNVTSATWTTPRSHNLITLTDNSTLNQIETANSTKMIPAP